MRVIIQRVKSSQVIVNGEIIGKIGRGLNLLVGIANTDTGAELDWMVRKCLELRLFPHEEIGTAQGLVDRHRWQKSVQEIGGELLVVSQFTLYGDCRKGRRPSFDRSAAPQSAEDLYNRFITKLRASGLLVETGQFGAMMQVTIENDGPVTLIIEKEAT
ncbi:D-aminoacyl-tRNA deacylase [Nostoc sp. PA-18-2419]|uniref:D-aminoacyl-tRNA deacylase n=1 Tax=Nostoc sp. PA-18-2419 TaxID=2575443 RepID=UPI001109DD33|nr:D-aminoacyl-tRNA deacylase [Nostoc sp. PA-18-2419]